MTARGFSLVELAVVLALLAAAFATVLPAAQSRRARQETEATLARTVEAIYAEHGFLADVGRLPVLPELTARGALPPARWSSGLPVGWAGPYLEGATADGWERALRLDPDGRVRSAGPNGIFDDEDDLIAPAYPPLPRGAAGSLCVEAPAGALVQALVPDASGAPAWVSATPAGSCGHFFAALPAGRRLVQAGSASAAVVVSRGASAVARLGGSL